MGHPNDVNRNNIFKKEMSFSSLKWVRKSPALYKFNVENPEFKPKTPALIFGNLYHTTVLEPHKINEEFFAIDILKRPDPTKSMNSTENKNWKAELEMLNSGKQLVEVSDINNAANMRDVLMDQVGEFITNVKEVEEELHWQKRGIDMKGFIDGNHPDYAFDLKSAIDATPDQWQRKANWQFDTDMQAAIYLDGDADGMYLGDKEFYFFAQEKTPPYLVSVHLVGKERINEGMHKYTAALTKLRNCRKANEWPHFDKTVYEWN